MPKMHRPRASAFFVALFQRWSYLQTPSCCRKCKSKLQMPPYAQQHSSAASSTIKQRLLTYHSNLEHDDSIPSRPRRVQHNSKLAEKDNTESRPAAEESKPPSPPQNGATTFKIHKHWKKEDSLIRATPAFAVRRQSPKKDLPLSIRKLPVSAAEDDDRNARNLGARDIKPFTVRRFELVPLEKLVQEANLCREIKIKDFNFSPVPCQEFSCPFVPSIGGDELQPGSTTLEAQKTSSIIRSYESEPSNEKFIWKQTVMQEDKLLRYQGRIRRQEIRSFRKYDIDSKTGAPGQANQVSRLKQRLMRRQAILSMHRQKPTSQIRAPVQVRQASQVPLRRSAPPAKRPKMLLRKHTALASPPTIRRHQSIRKTEEISSNKSEPRRAVRTYFNPNKERKIVGHQVDSPLPPAIRILDTEEPLTHHNYTGPSSLVQKAPKVHLDKWDAIDGDVDGVQKLLNEQLDQVSGSNVSNLVGATQRLVSKSSGVIFDHANITSTTAKRQFSSTAPRRRPPREKSDRFRKTPPYSPEPTRETSRSGHIRKGLAASNPNTIPKARLFTTSSNSQPANKIATDPSQPENTGVIEPENEMPISETFDKPPQNPIVRKKLARPYEKPPPTKTEESNTPTSSTSSLLKPYMREIPHSVVVVTTLRSDPSPLCPQQPEPPSQQQPPARPHINNCGVTISSLTTITLGPPTAYISFNLKVPSKTLSGILANRDFRVHFLTATEEGAEVANAFVKWSHESSFDELVATGKRYIGAGVGVGDVEPPVIYGAGVRGYLECSVVREKCIEVGDHMVVIARVDAVKPKLYEELPFGIGCIMYAGGEYKTHGRSIYVNNAAIRNVPVTKEEQYQRGEGSVRAPRPAVRFLGYNTPRAELIARLRSAKVKRRRHGGTEFPRNGGGGSSALETALQYVSLSRLELVRRVKSKLVERAGLRALNEDDMSGAGAAMSLTGGIHDDGDGVEVEVGKRGLNERDMEAEVIKILVEMIERSPEEWAQKRAKEGERDDDGGEVGKKDDSEKDWWNI